MWGCWEIVFHGPGGRWEEPDAGLEDPETLEGTDDDEYADI
jgi:hypothetical protein